MEFLYGAELIQVVVVVFALFAWSRALLRFKDRKISVVEFVLWTTVWVGAALGALFPRWIKVVSSFVGVGRPIDIVVYTSITLLFYLLFRIYVKVEQQNQQMTQLVRKIALQRKK